MSPWLSYTMPDPKPVAVEISTTDGRTLFTTLTSVCWKAEPAGFDGDEPAAVARAAANAPTINAAISARRPSTRATGLLCRRMVGVIGVSSKDLSQRMSRMPHPYLTRARKRSQVDFGAFGLRVGRPSSMEIITKTSGGSVGDVVGRLKDLIASRGLKLF